MCLLIELLNILISNKCNDWKKLNLGIIRSNKYSYNNLCFNESLHCILFVSSYLADLHHSGGYGMNRIFRYLQPKERGFPVFEMKIFSISRQSFKLRHLIYVFR